MVQNFDDLQKLSKDNMDMTLKQLGAVSRGFQAIAAEMADYSKKSFEESTALAEKLLGSKSVEKAMELQSAYIKNAYESFVKEATKISALYADLASEVCKPFAGSLAQASTK